MTDDTAKRLQEIEARHAASTPGEWECRRDYNIDEDNPYRYWVSNGGDYAMDEEGNYTETNADFIAHAHQDVPFLLAEIERLEARTETRPCPTR